ncbi:Lysine-specific demethylase 8 [Ophiocordyceps camponoti-floridani]|uniref:Lysine-specific demethylase 8 n=1 Tax=Ophiocordyceps camponoti-floridani TaxID=2030778 RepID=A0A8H4Q5W3_9HYPO|nr:Lysine-specific demethylase 8 [Ophiocordyceps camponoti-floridani]
MRANILLAFLPLSTANSHASSGHSSKVTKLTCGSMKDTTLPQFLNYTVLDVTKYNSDKPCVTWDCVRVLVETFPDGFINAMDSIAGKKRHRVVNDIVADLRFVNPDRYLEFIAWVLESGARQRTVCWLEDDVNYFPYYKDTIGALTAYLINPDLSDHRMYRRFVAMRPGPLQASLTACFEEGESTYQQIKLYLGELRAPSSVRWLPRFKTYDDIRWQTSQWSGLLGRLLYESTQEVYACPAVCGCDATLESSRPMLPRDHEHFWRTLHWLTGTEKPFCLTMGTKSPKSVLFNNWIAAGGGWSLHRFEQYINKSNEPIIFTDLINTWPALTNHPWNQPDYLLSQTLGGRRLVPIELGRSYVDQGWGQELMRFSRFLAEHVVQQTKTTGYLAQHDLFRQIPSLRRDVTIPDYCWASVPPHPLDPSQDQAVLHVPRLNAWFGPAGTITPLHTDGYHNLLCQVVGAKYVRLYPPDATPFMRPRGSELGVDMSNTSCIDLGVLEGWDRPPDHHQEHDSSLLQGVDYRECILQPGDTLLIPIGWWHYVRSLSISFSLSFWWN